MWHTYFLRTLYKAALLFIGTFPPFWFYVTRMPKNRRRDPRTLSGRGGRRGWKSRCRRHAPVASRRRTGPDGTWRRCGGSGGWMNTGSKNGGSWMPDMKLRNVSRDGDQRMFSKKTREICPCKNLTNSGVKPVCLWLKEIKRSVLTGTLVWGRERGGRQPPTIGPWEMTQPPSPEGQRGIGYQAVTIALRLPKVAGAGPHHRHV